MNSDRTLELHVDVDAAIEAAWKALTEAEGLANWFSPIAKVSGDGLGSEVTTGWSEDYIFTTPVDAWELHRRVRWRGEDVLGPGTTVTMDFHLEPAGGKSRVRLVLSGIGESEGWDGFFESAAPGWTYFFHHLRLYLEVYPGRTRRMISERLPVKVPRDAAWKHIAAALTGRAPADVAGLRAGDRVRLAFDGGPAANGIVEIVFVDKSLAVRLPELESVLFVDLEGVAPESFHAGWYLSVYDDGRAKQLEAPARRTFLRVHESMPVK